MKLRLTLYRAGLRRPKMGAGEGAIVSLRVGISNRTKAKSAVFQFSEVLVDTGADRSGIPAEIIPELEKVLGRLKKTTRPVYTGAGLSRLTVLEDVAVCIGPDQPPEIAGAPIKGGCCVLTSLLAVPNLQAGMLLGRDLLMPCRAKVDFGKKELCMDGSGCRPLEDA